MATRWVDNSTYFGPDRRRKTGKRWNDRRKYDDAGEPPPLAALLRRLRVRVSAQTAEDRRHAFEMLRAAINEANRLGWRQCAATLMNIDEMLRTGSGRQVATAADALINEALEHAAVGR